MQISRISCISSSKRLHITHAGDLLGWRCVEVTSGLLHMFYIKLLRLCDTTLVLAKKGRESEREYE